MKKFSKLIALVLSTVMVLTLLTSCSMAGDSFANFDRKFKSDSEKQAEILEEINDLRSENGNAALKETRQADAIAKKYAALYALYDQKEIETSVYDDYRQKLDATKLNGHTHIGRAAVTGNGENGIANEMDLYRWSTAKIYQSGSMASYSKVFTDSTATVAGIAVVQLNGRYTTVIVTF